MKDIQQFINEGQTPLSKIDRDMYSLIAKLLGQFVTGKIDIPETDNKQLIKDAQKLLFNMY